MTKAPAGGAFIEEQDQNFLDDRAVASDLQPSTVIDLATAARLATDASHWATCTHTTEEVRLPNGSSTFLTVCAGHGLTPARIVPKFSYHGQAAATAHDAYIDALLRLGGRWLVWKFRGGLAYGNVKIEGGLFLAPLEQAIAGRIAPTNPPLPGQHVYPQRLFQKVGEPKKLPASASLRERLAGGGS